jgi:hypothetical protein
LLKQCSDVLFDNRDQCAERPQWVKPLLNV